MPSQTWVQTLTSADAAGTQILNNTTQASIIPAECKFTLPAGFLRKGMQLRQFSTGQISCVVTTPGTLIFQTLFNAVVVGNSAAVATSLNIVAKTNVTYWLECFLTCRSVGSGTSATMIAQYVLTTEAIVGATAGQPLTQFIPASAPVVGTGFDSTVAQSVDLQAKFSVATATTALTSMQYAFQSMQ